MRSVCFWLACLVLLGVLFGCGSGRGGVRETVLLQSPSAETEVVRFGSAAELSGDLEILGILVEDAAHDWSAEEAARAAALLWEAADYLEAQAREAGGALTCRVQGAEDRLRYAGDLCPAGEDGMLLNAAAEEFLDAIGGAHHMSSTLQAGRFGAWTGQADVQRIPLAGAGALQTTTGTQTSIREENAFSAMPVRRGSALKAVDGAAMSAADGLSAVFASGGQGSRMQRRTATALFGKERSPIDASLVEQGGAADGLCEVPSARAAGSAVGSLCEVPLARATGGATSSLCEVFSARTADASGDMHQTAAAPAQMAYLLLVNAAGEGYALPQLSATEAELFREKAVIFCRDATPAQVAAQLARLCAPGGKLFAGAALSPEGDFRAEFRAYLAGGESKM